MDGEPSVEASFVPRKTQEEYKRRMAEGRKTYNRRILDERENPLKPKVF